MSKKKQPKITKAKEPEIRYKSTIPSDSFIAQLSPVLFWDTDINKIDAEKHAAYIVERVMTRGTLDEFKLLIQYYGKSRVSETVKNLRYLDERTLHFCSAYFNVPINQFRCYIEKQSSPTHWNY